MTSRFLRRDSFVAGDAGASSRAAGATIPPGKPRCREPRHPTAATLVFQAFPGMASETVGRPQRSRASLSFSGPGRSGTYLAKGLT